MIVPPLTDSVLLTTKPVNPDKAAPELSVTVPPDEVRVPLPLSVPLNAIL